jgi:hypothetical protein
MSRDELIALGNDIKRNGLQMPIGFLKEPDESSPGDYRYRLLDGRSRLDAMTAVGVEFDLWLDGHPYLHVDHKECIGNARVLVFGPFETEEEVWACVESLNVHRRHLDTEGKRDAIARILKAKTELSDRAIGKMVKADHKTVGATQSAMEGRGEIPHAKTRKDTKGRQQPALKQRGHDEQRQRERTAAKPEPPKADKSKPFDDIVRDIRFAVDAVMDEVPPAEWEYLFVDLHDMLRNLLEVRTASRAKPAASADFPDIPDFLLRKQSSA